MATQTIGVQTVEQDLVNLGLVKGIEAGKGVREKAAQFLGKIAWRVSMEVQPLLAGFVPPYTMECLTSKHLSSQEKTRIAAELTIGF